VAVSRLQETGDLQVARHGVSFEPVGEKVHDPDGHGFLAAGEPLLEVLHPAPQFVVLLNVRLPIGISDAGHERFLVSQVLAREPDEVGEQICQNLFAATREHRLMQPLGEGEDLLVLSVNFRVPDGVVFGPLEHLQISGHDGSPP
jgi:hypothetical protein